MRAADISGLFQQSQEGGADYAQGLILEFDPDTGENAVSVNGSILENLPILNTGEAITLKPTHVVGLLRWKSQWFILGRITVAGSGQFAAASTLSKSDLENFDNITITTTPTIKGTLLFAVPSWADRVVVQSVAAYGLRNTAANVDNFAARTFTQTDIATSPGFTARRYQTVEASAYARYETADNREINCSGAASVSVWSQAQTTSQTWSADIEMALTLTATLTFRSTV